jgi:hypothetical protein
MTPLDRASGRFEVLADMMVLVHQQADSRCGLRGQVGVGAGARVSSQMDDFHSSHRAPARGDTARAQGV